MKKIAAGIIEEEKTRINLENILPESISLKSLKTKN
jgi:hypothetical protein